MGAEGTLIVQNDLAELERLADFLSCFGAEHELSGEFVLELNLALEEVFCNIVKHGYRDQQRHEITVGLECKEGTILLNVEDDAAAFNPLDAPDPVLEGPLEDRPIGGLGIHMVRTVMDDVEYRRDGGRNVLRMKKRVETEG